MKRPNGRITMILAVAIAVVLVAAFGKFLIDAMDGISRVIVSW